VAPDARFLGRTLLLWDLQGVRCIPAPTRGAGSSRATRRFDLGPDAPPGHEGARERRVREVEWDRVVQYPAGRCKFIPWGRIGVIGSRSRRLGSSLVREALKQRYVAGFPLSQNVQIDYTCADPTQVIGD
jgi:hypothetical protein